MERVGDYIVFSTADHILRFIKISDSAIKTPKSEQSQKGFEFDDEIDNLELNDRVIAISGGLNENHQMIAIDMMNTFYKIDVTKRQILFKTEKREEGSISTKICIMNSREENWLACGKWDYE